MNKLAFAGKMEKALMAAAVLFGILTIVGGSRVLLGGDPGYVVFQPLLIFNTAMGPGYIAAGIMVCRNLVLARRLAAVIVILNLCMLGMTTVFWVSGDSVAVQSLLAMLFRTLVWLGLLFVLQRHGDRGNLPELPAA